MKVAGIDCGTNSIRLLIAEVDSEYRVHDIVRRMEIVRLGMGVDRTQKFNEQALAKTLAVVSEYAQLCRNHNVQSIRFAATSATRDAQNRDVFLCGVAERLGVVPQILSGTEEAECSFIGALSALPKGCAEPILTVDLGGGSTELTLGYADGKIISAYSMDVGCVRMTERHLAQNPLATTNVDAARYDVREFLAQAQEVVDLGAPRTVIGLAGSVTSITAFVLGLQKYDSQKIHGTKLAIGQIDKACNWFINASLESRKAVPFMHPERADVIHAGALVWQEIVHHLAEQTARNGVELENIITSEHDILDGLAIWAAKDPNYPKAQF